VRSPSLKLEQPSLLLAQGPDDWMEVIGVVGDARNNGLSRPIKPAVFIPYSFVLPPDESLLVRASGDPDAAIRSVKERLRKLNAEIVVSQERTVLWVAGYAGMGTRAIHCNALWAFCRTGAGAGSNGTLQRGFFCGDATDAGVGHSHGTGSAA